MKKASPVIQKAKPPKAEPAAPDKSKALYSVIPGVTCISRADGKYPVVDGVVSLPANETWYLDMVGFTLLERVG